MPYEIAQEHADREAEKFFTTVEEIIRYLEDLSKDLRRMITDDARERAKTNPMNIDGKAGYGHVARDVLSKIKWGLANSPIDRMVSQAAEADVMVRLVGTSLFPEEG